MADPTRIALPRLPFDEPRATVVRWLRAPGEALAPGDPLLVVVGERAETLLPAPLAGTLAQLLAPEGAAVEVGAPLAALAAAAPPPRATPLARRVALALQVDIAVLQGSGDRGRILRGDVLRAAGSATPTATPALAVPRPPSAAPTRPPLAAAEVNLAPALALTGLGDHALPAAVARAVAAALLRFPRFHALPGDDALAIRRRLVLALRLPGEGQPRLLRDAADRNLRGVARALERATAGPADAATMVVTLSSAALPAPPPLDGRAAALALGTPQLRPAAIGGALGALPLAWLVLAYDPRAALPHEADAFLAALRAALEAPIVLV